MTDTVATAELLPEFRVGRVLSQTFSTFFGNFFKFFFMGMLLYAPFLLLGGLLTFSAFQTTDPTAPPSVPVALTGFVGMMAVMIVSSSLIFSAITYGSIEYQAGKPVSFLGMLKKSGKSLVPVILASLMIGPLYMLGAMLLVVPGIIVLLMFCVTIPAIVAEEMGPMAAMRRSSELTSGYKWKIFGTFLVVMLIMQLTIIMVGFGTTAGLKSLPVGAVSIASSILTLITSGALYGVLGSCVASIYTSLRAAKEGTPVDKIAEVFS